MNKLLSISAALLLAGCVVPPPNPVVYQTPTYIPAPRPPVVVVPPQRPPVVVVPARPPVYPPYRPYGYWR